MMYSMQCLRQILQSTKVLSCLPSMAWYGLHRGILMQTSSIYSSEPARTFKNSSRLLQDGLNVQQVHYRLAFESLLKPDSSLEDMPNKPSKYPDQEKYDQKWKTTSDLLKAVRSEPYTRLDAVVRHAVNFVGLHKFSASDLAELLQIACVRGLRSYRQLGADLSSLQFVVERLVSQQDPVPRDVLLKASFASARLMKLDSGKLVKKAVALHGSNLYEMAPEEFMHFVGALSYKMRHLPVGSLRSLRVCFEKRVEEFPGNIAVLTLASLSFLGKELCGAMSIDTWSSFEKFIVRHQANLSCRNIALLALSLTHQNVYIITMVPFFRKYLIESWPKFSPIGIGVLLYYLHMCNGVDNDLIVQLQTSVSELVMSKCASPRDVDVLIQTLVAMREFPATAELGNLLVRTIDIKFIESCQSWRCASLLAGLSSLMICSPEMACHLLSKVLRTLNDVRTFVQAVDAVSLVSQQLLMHRSFFISMLLEQTQHFHLCPAELSLPAAAKLCSNFCDMRLVQPVWLSALEEFVCQNLDMVLSLRKKAIHLFSTFFFLSFPARKLHEALEKRVDVSFLASIYPERYHQVDLLCACLDGPQPENFAVSSEAVSYVYSMSQLEASMMTWSRKLLLVAFHAILLRSSRSYAYPSLPQDVKNLLVDSVVRRFDLDPLPAKCLEVVEKVLQVNLYWQPTTEDGIPVDGAFLIDQWGLPYSYPCTVQGQQNMQALVMNLSVDSAFLSCKLCPVAILALPAIHFSWDGSYILGVYRLIVEALSRGGWKVIVLNASLDDQQGYIVSALMSAGIALPHVSPEIKHKAHASTRLSLR